MSSVCPGKHSISREREWPRDPGSKGGPGSWCSLECGRFGHGNTTSWDPSRAGPGPIASPESMPLGPEDCCRTELGWVMDICTELVDVRSKKCDSCGPGDGENFFFTPGHPSGHKDQDSSREIPNSDQINLRSCCFLFLGLGSASTDLVRFKFGFAERLVPKKRNLLAKRPFLKQKGPCFKRPLKLDRVSFSTPDLPFNTRVDGNL